VTSVHSVVRWGLIGAGDIVRRRVAGALRDAPASALIAVSRGRSDLVEAFAREVGAQRWYGDWRALVADAELDAVYIATPVHLHAEQTIAAAEAGKHVLCEKPLAMSAAECARMLAACRANAVKLGVAYYRRFYPAVKQVKAIIDSGEIGAPVFVQMNAFEHFDPPPDHPRAWLLRPAIAGGGPMMDFGCHRIEVLVNLFGSQVRQATAVMANVVFDRPVEDTAAVLLQFEAGPCASVTVTHAARERQDTLHVFGTRGSIHVDDLNAGTLRLDADAVQSFPPAANVHLPLVEDFVDAVLTDREPAVSGETGRAVAAIEDIIYAVAPSVR
jgi:1,5-anhydro-D-fructose reductase (1,5-anhydro-D-mannitol-forming)